MMGPADASHPFRQDIEALWEASLPRALRRLEADWFAGIGISAEVRLSGALPGWIRAEARRLPGLEPPPPPEPQWFMLPDGSHLLVKGEDESFLVPSALDQDERRRVLVFTVPDAGDGDGDWFLRMAASLLLLGRGTVCLHASSVAAGEGAIILAGASGGGKSTALETFLAAGSRIIADEFSPVHRAARGFEVLPGYPVADVLEEPGHPSPLRVLARDEVPLVSGKVRLMLDPSDVRMVREPLPLLAIYFLVPDDAEDGIRLARLPAREGFVTLLRSSWNTVSSEAAVLRDTHDLLADLARDVGVTELRRGTGAGAPRPLLRHVILEDLAARGLVTSRGAVQP